MGYCGCRLIERDDVVTYHDAGNRAPLIKMVKGLAGDTLALRPTTASTRFGLVGVRELLGKVEW